MPAIRCVFSLVSQQLLLNPLKVLWFALAVLYLKMMAWAKAKIEMNPSEPGGRSLRPKPTRM